MKDDGTREQEVRSISSFLSWLSLPRKTQHVDKRHLEVSVRHIDLF